MLRAVITLLAVLAVVSAWSGQAPTKLESGDVLRIDVVGFESLSGTYTVLSDGTISVPRIGSVAVRGKTLDEVKALVTGRFAKFVKSPTVDVTLESERPRVVYVAGEGVIAGVAPWFPEMGVRALFAIVLLPGTVDQLQVTLYRDGRKMQEVDLSRLMSDEDSQDVPLRPGDLLTVMPLRATRVWVLGNVVLPGEYRVEKGATVAQALGLAGGVVAGDFNLSEITIKIQRRSKTIEMSGRPDDPLASTKLEPRDTVLVTLPIQRRVTVAGYVENKGEQLVPDGTSVREAIERAGGKTVEGTLKKVLVFRQGEALSFDLTTKSDEMPLLGPIVEQGDLIYVTDNKDDFYVFGFIKSPGRFFMPDERPTSLLDALESAGGLAVKGVLRRVVLMRPDSTGKLTSKTYDLDRFIKDGVTEHNPLLKPGDVIYFQQTDSSDLSGVLRIVSAALLLDRLIN